MRQRPRLKAARSIGLLATVSARALKVDGTSLAVFFHHDGMGDRGRPRVAPPRRSCSSARYCSAACGGAGVWLASQTKERASKRLWATHSRIKRYPIAYPRTISQNAEGANILLSV